MLRQSISFNNIDFSVTWAMPDKEHMQFTERTVADSPSKSKEDRDASYYNSVIVDVSCSELALKQS